MPNAFILDPSGEQTSNEVRGFCHKIGTTLRILEERTQHADRAELYIGLLKEDVRKELRELHAPMELWCYCAERRAAISNLTSKNLFQLQVQNPHLMALGEPGDVSNLCQFGWYEWCCVSQVKKDFSEPAEDLGRCLVPSNNEGNEMCQSVLQMNGQVVPRRSLCRIRTYELAASNASET